MKQLKIKVSLSEYNELPYIYLGNKTWLRHKSKTFLKKYARTYTKVLKDNIRILNNHHINVYSLFRNFYFDLNTIEAHQVTDYINDHNKNFNWIFSNVGGDQNS